MAAYQYRDAARFGRQVSAYLDTFGSGQVRILLVEDLRGGGEDAVARDLCQFLGLIRRPCRPPRARPSTQGTHLASSALRSSTMPQDSFTL